MRGRAFDGRMRPVDVDTVRRVCVYEYSDSVSRELEDVLVSVPIWAYLLNSS